MFNWNTHNLGGQRFPIPQQPMMPFVTPPQMPAVHPGGHMPYQQPGPWMPTQGAPMHPPMGLMMDQSWQPQPPAMFPMPGNLMGARPPMAPLHPHIEEKPPLPAEPPPPLPSVEEKPPLPPVEPAQPSPKIITPQPPPDPAALAELEKIEQEEKIFSDQYKDWKKQYDDWREQNESHPNKEQYQQYLEQWKTYERQMESKRESLLSEKEKLLNKFKKPSAIDSSALRQKLPAEQSSGVQSFPSPAKEIGPSQPAQIEDEEKGEEDMNIDEEESGVGGIIESRDDVPSNKSWEQQDNQSKGQDLKSSKPKSNANFWDFSASEQPEGNLTETPSGGNNQTSQWNNPGQAGESFQNSSQQSGPLDRNIDYDARDPAHEFAEFQRDSFNNAEFSRGRGADRGFFNNRGGRGGFDRGGFERSRGGFGRGRGNVGGIEGVGEGFEGNIRSYDEDTGEFNRGRGRGGFESGRGGRGAFDGGRGSRGAFDSGRGGRGGFDGSKGDNDASTSGYGASGFDGGRGGFEGGRGGFDGGTGGFEGGRGGFDGGRGGFEGSRDGFEGGRGGFDGGRGGFEGGRGGFEGGRGGFEGGRGGFDGGRGGFEGARSFEGGRDGFEGGRGGFDGGRGGFEGGRGGFEGGRGGFDGGRGGFEGGRGSFEGGRGGFDGGRGGFEGGRGGFDGGRGGFEGGRGGFDGGRGGFEGGRGGFDGGRGGSEGGRGGFDGGRGGFERGRGRGTLDGNRGGFARGRGRGGFEGYRGEFEGGRGGFGGGRGGFEEDRSGFEGFEGERTGFEESKDYEYEPGTDAFEGDRGFGANRGGFGPGRGSFDRGRGGHERGRGGQSGFDGARGGFDGTRGDYEGAGGGHDGIRGGFESGRGGRGSFGGGRGGFDRGRGGSDEHRGRGGYQRGRGGFDSGRDPFHEYQSDIEGAGSSFVGGRGRFQRGRPGLLQGTRGRGGFERGRGGFQGGRGGFGGNMGGVEGEWDGSYEDQEGFDTPAVHNEDFPTGERGGHFGQRGRRPGANQDSGHSDFREGGDNQGFGPNRQAGGSRGGFQGGDGQRGHWPGNRDGPDHRFDAQGQGARDFDSENQFEHNRALRTQRDFEDSSHGGHPRSEEESQAGMRRDPLLQDDNYPGNRAQEDQGPPFKRGRFDLGRDDDRFYPPPHPEDFVPPRDPYRLYPDPYLRDPYYDPRDPYYPPPPLPPPYRYDPYDRYDEWGPRYDPLYERRPTSIPDAPHPALDKTEKVSAAQPAEVIEYGHGQSSKEKSVDPASNQEDSWGRQQSDRDRYGEERASESVSSRPPMIYDHGHTRSGEPRDDPERWRSGSRTSPTLERESERNRQQKSDLDRDRGRLRSPSFNYIREREEREKAGFRDTPRGQYNRENLRDSENENRNRERESERPRRDERYKDSIIDDHRIDATGRTESRFRDSNLERESRDHSENFSSRRRSREREIEGGRRSERAYDDRSDRGFDGDRYGRRSSDVRGIERRADNRSDIRDYDGRLQERLSDNRRDRGDYRREDSRSSGGGRRDEWDNLRSRDRFNDRSEERDPQRRDYDERYRGEPGLSHRNEVPKNKESERWHGGPQGDEPGIPRRPERTPDGRHAGSLRDQYLGSFSPDVTGTPPLIAKSPIHSSFKKDEVVKVEDILCSPGRDSRPPQIVTILRGLPGSGKTYVSKLLREKEISFGGHAPRMLCLDDYFMVEVDKSERDPDTGKTIKKKVLEYEYEQELEDAYRQSLLKSFKKTVDDGFFPFIILDATNEKVSHFSEFWSYAKSKGFQVYVAELNADIATCINRNIHRWTEWDIEKVKSNWEHLPRHYIRLDLRWLLQEDSIPEVIMEDTVDEEETEAKEEGDEENSPDFEEGIIKKSKWELDTSEETLDKLDGIRVSKKHIEEHQSMSMDEYLQLDQMDEDYFTRESVPGKKRVRWADLEEKKTQSRRRDLGFIVGQTQRDWDRITDDDFAEKALNQTKYFYK